MRVDGTFAVAYTVFQRDAGIPTTVFSVGTAPLNGHNIHAVQQAWAALQAPGGFYAAAAGGAAVVPAFQGVVAGGTPPCTCPDPVLHLPSTCPVPLPAFYTITIPAAVMSTHLDAGYAGPPIPAINLDLHRMVGKLKNVSWD
jgi:hypothetical protein